MSSKTSQISSLLDLISGNSTKRVFCFSLDHSPIPKLKLILQLKSRFSVAPKSEFSSLQFRNADGYALWMLLTVACIGHPFHQTYIIRHTDNDLTSFELSPGKLSATHLGHHLFRCINSYVINNVVFKTRLTAKQIINRKCLAKPSLMLSPYRATSKSPSLLSIRMAGSQFIAPISVAVPSFIHRFTQKVMTFFSTSECYTSAFFDDQLWDI